jgi:diadenosine tetraphosphate (Ap4A) HIT family hydrolase
MEKPCFFCDAPNLGDGQIFAETKNFYARWDDMPCTPGHCEIAPKKHIDSYFSLSPEQVVEMHGLAQQVKVIIEQQVSPDGYNIGLNEGEAAGRTVPHLHLHIMPRYDGDVENPRGGIRNIIPGNGDYSEALEKMGREKYR